MNGKIMTKSWGCKSRKSNTNVANQFKNKNNNSNNMAGREMLIALLNWFLAFHFANFPRTLAVLESIERINRNQTHSNNYQSENKWPQILTSLVFQSMDNVALIFMEFALWHVMHTIAIYCTIFDIVTVILLSNVSLFALDIVFSAFCCVVLGRNKNTKVPKKVSENN